MPGPYLAVNSAVVAAEDFDGEMVVINFERGLFFSLSGSAPEVWAMFRVPTTVQDASRVLAERYGLDREEATAHVSGFVTVLAAEGCLLETTVSSASETVAPDKAVHPFAPPVVEVFRDLADLMAIDPVHEVDALEGWPRKPLRPAADA